MDQGQILQTVIRLLYNVQLQHGDKRRMAVHGPSMQASPGIHVTWWYTEMHNHAVLAGVSHFGLLCLAPGNIINVICFLYMQSYVYTCRLL